MNFSELQEYDGKSVLASYCYSESKGIVFQGKFYRIDVNKEELPFDQLTLELIEYSPEDLLGVQQFGNGKLSLFEKGVLHSLELNLPAIEAFIPFNIRKVKK